MMIFFADHQKAAPWDFGLVLHPGYKILVRYFPQSLSIITRGSGVQAVCFEGEIFFTHKSCSILVCLLTATHLPAQQDGDVIQLGIDYQGGAEEMYRCVKMKVEVGRQWGKVADKFK
jgi:hypothetical protein